MGDALDEWAVLVQDRDAQTAEIRRLADSVAAQRRAHLDELTRLQRIINEQAAALSRLGYRKTAKRRAKATQEARPAEEPDLDAVPSATACGPCGGPRTALDDVLGHVDCRVCRAARVPGQPIGPQGGQVVQ